jgi:positive regulator of sigma E activity
MHQFVSLGWNAQDAWSEWFSNQNDHAVEALAEVISCRSCALRVGCGSGLQSMLTGWVILQDLTATIPQNPNLHIGW